MSPVDLEQLVPGYRAARQKERLHRALAFAEVPWTLCGQSCLHLTPRHRIELQLAQNAFALELRPLQGDVFQFLWRLSPAFSREPLSWRSARAKRRLESEMRHLPIHGGEREINEYLTAMLQDMPENGEARNSINPPENYVHWMASEARFFIVHFGLSFEAYKDTPYLVLQQFARAHRLATEEDPQFINASDRLVNEWTRANTVRYDR